MPGSDTKTVTLYNKTIPAKPEKQAKLIDEAVAKLARQWEKKYDRGMK